MSLKKILFGSSVDIEQIEKERDSYKQKSEKLDQELSELKELLANATSSGKNTSFVSGKIQKIQELEDELSIQKDRVQEVKKIAQDANQVKHEFLANMRHEVRTPMNSIIAFSDMLVHELKDKTQLSYAKNIFSSGHKLLALLDDIIELSRLESGVFEVNTTAIDTMLYFTNIVKEHEPKAYNKGILLALDIDAEIPKSLMLDDEKVKSILDNLIDNAIKFTTQGTIRVKVIVEKQDFTQNKIDITIVIVDTGMGIDSKNHQKIFEIFEKRENCNEIEFQGTGLGLSINKKMAQLMDGDIGLSSKLGEGSSFSLILKDLEVVLQSAEDKIDESNIDFGVVKPEGARIMVIDDVQSSCEVIESVFKETNTEVFAYSSPREALEALIHNTFDLIFIDINILSMDENAVSKVLAKMSKAPVVSLTSTSIKDVEFVKDGAKIVGHLKKPISKMELFKITLKILSGADEIANFSKNSIQTNTEFADLDKKSVEQFLLNHSKEVLPLFKQAILTNDLNTMGTFAKTLLPLAKEYKINTLIKFAQELLAKIELFDIETINTMMSGYEAKIKRLQNL